MGAAVGIWVYYIGRLKNLEGIWIICKTGNGKFPTHVLRSCAVGCEVAVEVAVVHFIWEEGRRLHRALLDSKVAELT